MRLLETTALGVVMLDAVLYLAVVRPLRRMVTAEERRLTVARQQLQQAEHVATRLEKYLAALPDVEGQMRDFLQKHVVPRRRGFSQAARLVRLLTEASNLQLASVAYKLESAPDEPLERLEVDVSVVGSFRNLLAFAHALETSSDLLLIRECVFEPAEQGALGLRLRANLYLQR